MKERNLSEVRAALTAQQRELDKAIASQSFFCRKQRRMVSPAECHDCFSVIPYFEKLSRWKEDRMLCIKEHAEAVRSHAASGERDRREENSVKEKPKGKNDSPAGGYSIEEYVSRSILEFFLELDSLAEKFETWWLALAPQARSRIHKSAELMEALQWFGERLREFQCALVRIARSPEGEEKTDDSKEESCGVKN